MVYTCIDITDYKRLKVFAAARGMSIKAVVNDAITEYIARRCEEIKHDNP